MQIIVDQGTPPPRSPAVLPEGVPRWVWWLVGLAGGVVILEALIDLAIGFYPAQFGNLEWEFVAVSQALAALPLLTVGLLALVFSAVGLRSRLGLRLAAVVVLVAAATVVAGYALFALGVAPALRAVTEYDARLGLKKVIVKTSALAAGFTLLYLAAGIACLRGASTSSRKPNA